VSPMSGCDRCARNGKCADRAQRLCSLGSAKREQCLRQFAHGHDAAIRLDQLDNVGAEWPSLLELRSFPFVELKVDHQFVTGSADQRLKQTVCRRIVELAHDSRTRIVAQGVETRADFLAAHDMDFDLVQGYLFGKPMGIRKFARSRVSLPSGSESEL